MNILSAIFALPKGLLLCFFNSDVRRFAIKPWLYGIVVYFITMIAAFSFHEELFGFFFADAKETMNWFFLTMIWLFSWGVLFVFAILISAILVVVFTIGLQAQIVTSVLRTQGIERSDRESSSIAMAGSTILNEILKLALMLPLMLLATVTGFIPPLFPFAFLLGSWLLGFEFLDIALDEMDIKASERLKLSTSHGLSVTAFGATLVTLWAIPFLGIVLTPAAVAGATWYATKAGIIERSAS